MLTRGNVQEIEKRERDRRRAEEKAEKEMVKEETRRQKEEDKLRQIQDREAKKEELRLDKEKRAEERKKAADIRKQYVFHLRHFKLVVERAYSLSIYQLVSMRWVSDYDWICSPVECLRRQCS